MTEPIDWVAIIERARAELLRQPAYRPDGPIILSRARFDKCKAGNHETLHDICIHCMTDTRRR